MSPTSAPEKTGASGPYNPVPAPPPPRRMLSPLGYLGLAAAMFFTIVVVFWVMSAFKEPAGVTPIPDRFEKVDLGEFSRELATESGSIVRDHFMLKVVLVLNPKLRDLGAVKAEVERRRDLFRHVVWTEIINPKSDADLRKPALVDSLTTEIRQRVNQELGGPKDGQEIVSRVLFPDRRVPERR